MLQFFGRGSAFADQHNAAFFREQGDLILLDCPETAFQKVKCFDWSNVFNVYVLVTHTHGDHIGGLGTLLQYLFFTQHKRLTVVAPSELVQEDLQLQLIRIEGCQPEWFSLSERAEAAKTLAAKGSAHRAYRHAPAEMLWICINRCRQDGGLYGRYSNARAVSSVSASGQLLIYRTCGNTKRCAFVCTGYLTTVESPF